MVATDARAYTRSDDPPLVSRSRMTLIRSGPMCPHTLHSTSPVTLTFCPDSAGVRAARQRSHSWTTSGLLALCTKFPGWSAGGGDRQISHKIGRNPHIQYRTERLVYACGARLRSTDCKGRNRFQMQDSNLVTPLWSGLRGSCASLRGSKKHSGRQCLYRSLSNRGRGFLSAPCANLHTAMRYSLYS